MKGFAYWSRTKQMGVLQEAVDWAIGCASIHSIMDAIVWAIEEYRWNLADEDTMDKADRRIIKRKIATLVAISNRMG